MAFGLFIFARKLKTALSISGEGQGMGIAVLCLFRNECKSNVESYLHCNLYVILFTR